MFELTLTNGSEDINLLFNVLDTNIAKKWRLEIAQDYNIVEDKRFSNFPNTHKNKDYFKVELVKCIDIINSYCPGTIPLELIDINQDVMNRLHKYFEVLRGPVLDTSLFYIESTNIVKQSLIDLNLLIHECEHYMFNEQYLPVTEHPYSTIVCTYDRPRYRLMDEDYEHYTYKWEFGTVYINYCEVGKPLLDVFKDNDDIVGDDNIRPLDYYSADWQLKLGPSTRDDVYTERTRQFKEWFNVNKDRINLPYDNKLALGMIPVAVINTEASNLLNMSQVDIVNTLSKYNRVKNTCIR